MRERCDVGCDAAGCCGGRCGGGGTDGSGAKAVGGMGCRFELGLLLLGGGIRA